MRKYILLCILCISYSCIMASDMSDEKQYEIISNYMYLTGQLSPSQATAYSEEKGLTELSGKCGMSIALEFKQNFDKFDSHILKSSGVQLAPRPDFLPNTVVSPSGKFLIHFATTGEHAVYSNVPGGAFGYVDSVAFILDEVYEHIIDTLGYPEPPLDSFYVSGGDEKYDVYLVDIAFYGLTYLDSVLYNIDSTVITATSYLELENDYVEISQYKDRPLDAVRVTAAHEFFHSVQFGIDATETDQNSIQVDGPAWMEMSAVWMEEEIYDDVNDYYYYLPFFFDDPSASIQQFTTTSDLHPYASGIFPMFLSQKFDRDIIKSIWTKCGEYGPGSQFLPSVGEVVDSASAGAESYETVFSEFALWNYFTGSRAHLAPNNIGYSEREDFNVEFSEDQNETGIRVENQYPVDALESRNAFYYPSHNSAFYLTLKNIDHLVAEYNCIDSSTMYDSTYWVCNTGSFPTCTDSTEVTSSDIYDTFYVNTSVICSDSVKVLNFILFLDLNFTHAWGINLVYDYKYYYDSVDFEAGTFPQGAGLQLFIPTPSEYNSVTYILTPASTTRDFYNGVNKRVAFLIQSESDTTLIIDSTLIHASTPTEIFFPYPNPAVVKEMKNDVVNFSFKLPIDSTFLLESTQPDTILVGIDLSETVMVIDIFNINGEMVRSIVNNSVNNIGVTLSEWDLKNQYGNDVASGVYLAYARLYENDIDGKLLIEEKTKIAVIR